MIKHVFLDMDGVLADFVSGAMSLHGRIFDAATYMPGEWQVEKVLGIEEWAFWHKIHHAGEDFWLYLPAYPWKNELLTMASMFDRVTVLTKPSAHHSSHAGKRQWAVEHLPTVPLILCEDDKDLLARPDRLLIDDNDQNVAAWRAAGGQAILFPRMWNSLHGRSLMPMIHVGMELNSLLVAEQTKHVTA